jgi:hypothetical protein
VIFQLLWCDFPRKIGVESWSICQCQNFTSVRIFHDDGARFSMSLLYRCFQFSFSDVLNLFVHRQYYVLAWIRLLLDASKPFTPGVDRNKHTTRFPMKLVIVHADVAQNLGRQISFRVETFRLFLEMNAAQVQRAYAVSDLGVSFSRNPAESPCSFALGKQFPRVNLGNARDQRYCSRKIGYFGGHREHRIHRNRHRQFASGTVINNSALCRHIGGPLLLVLRPGEEVAITEDLQVDQPDADRPSPEQQDRSEQVESFVCAVSGCTRHRLAP